MAFLVRLEDPDSDHFRETSISGPDIQTKDDARAWCEQRERDLVAYQLPEDELKRIEAIDKASGQVLSGADKGRLHGHRQAKPYKVVSVKEA